jgi:ABC-2 type transport system permease protein
VLVFSAALFLMTSLGVGLFVSTISQTQQQAIMTVVVDFDADVHAERVCLSDSEHNMPIAVQYFSYLNPLRYLIEIVRGIFLKGVGVSILWPQMLTLAVYGMAIMALSASSFKKRLD